MKAAVGRLGAKPTAEATQIQINLQTKGRLSSSEEFGAIILRANPDGSLLRVLEDEPDLSPKEATKKAMKQITGPIVAISLVLLSVFVPIGFIPGLSGQLFRQFAVTISVAMIISAINALTLSPALCGVFLRHTGKKRGAMVIGLIAFLGSPMPIVLRLTGILPDNGSPLIFWVVFLTTLFDTALIITFEILSASMMADLVEQSEVKTGRRSEGVFASAITFTQKLVNGIGLMLASFVITLAGVKTGADASHVSHAALWRLGSIYVPTIITLWMVMVAVIGAYAINRDSHAENLRTLAARRAAE